MQFLCKVNFHLQAFYQSPIRSFYPTCSPLWRYGNLGQKKIFSAVRIFPPIYIYFLYFTYFLKCCVPSQMCWVKTRSSAVMLDSTSVHLLKGCLQLLQWHWQTCWNVYNPSVFHQFRPTHGAGNELRLD